MKKVLLFFVLVAMALVMVGCSDDSSSGGSGSGSRGNGAGWDEFPEFVTSGSEEQRIFNDRERFILYSGVTRTEVEQAISDLQAEGFQKGSSTSDSDEITVTFTKIIGTSGYFVVIAWDDSAGDGECTWTFGWEEDVL
ncbi:MAG: hypothetical protein LBV04_04710 [Deferribacteraceae bacterium]|jgi:phosphoglycolate phosphatase-like HAD superfamily hydrolase|nr:hypothetical protein [Deferribacteraceae bacterium]